jgi:hypothetical protein
MMDLLLDFLAIIGIGSAMIAIIAGFSYARQMHRHTENDR